MELINDFPLFRGMHLRIIAKVLAESLWRQLDHAQSIALV